MTGPVPLTVDRAPGELSALSALSAVSKVQVSRFHVFRNAQLTMLRPATSAPMALSPSAMDGPPPRTRGWGARSSAAMPRITPEPQCPRPSPGDAMAMLLLLLLLLLTVVGQ